MEELIVRWLQWFESFPLPVEVLIAIFIGVVGLILLLVLVRLLFGILNII